MKQHRIFRLGHGLIAFAFAALLALPLAAGIAGAAEKAKWSGVDEAVIETIAKEHGREAKPALIDKEQGDILLFMFLIAGAVGGFAAGYYWRVLVTDKTGQMHRKSPNKQPDCRSGR